MVIQLNKVSKTYVTPGSDIENNVLDEISIDINRGETISVVGPSGSGKSTLLNIAGTLDKPSTGNVLFNGVEVNSLDDKSLAKIRNRHIGFVFQLHHLLPQLSLIENILLPTLTKEKSQKNNYKQRALELIDFVGLIDKIHQRPGQMSVGECQRTAVVRALINQPEVLLADEPTGSLDRESAEQIGELLVNLNLEKKLTMIVVTHDIQLARKMKMKYAITDGKLVGIK